MSTVSSSAREKPFYWPAVYAAVALTTMAALVLELSLTRIFSVVFYYHFAFLAISIALFGLGAGGVLSYFFTARARNLYRSLGMLASWNAAATVGALVYILRCGGGSGFWQLAAVYFAAALPFFFSGIIISVAIAETIARVERVYFFDLMGAAGGCLLLVPLLNIVGGPSAVIGAAAMSAASGAVWFVLGGSARGRATGVGLALALVGLMIYNPRGRLIDITAAKGREIGREVFTRWNSFSRIGVTQESDRWRTIVIDGDATTGIANFDFNNLSEADLRALRLQSAGFPYRLRPGAKTLVIGAGGGWDMARAIASGSRDVTGVEINPIIANTIMRQRHAAWSQGIYMLPQVRIAVEDGRSFVRRGRERYQVLQMTLVDTWASTAAGAFALSENNLYTVEAFEDYLNRLTPDGVLAISRWGFDPPRESLRLLSLASTALERLGQREPWRNVLLVREGGRKELEGMGALDTVLIARQPFTAADLATARAAAAESGFERVYFPDERLANPFTTLLTSTARAAFYSAYRYDVTPVFDDRPFFFYTVQPRDIFHFRSQEKSAAIDFKVNLAVPTLFSLLGVSLLATLVTLVLPPVIAGSRLPRERGVMSFLAYFVCLGMGYILVQVGLIQKLVLFLGHPTYALTVVIFSMLLASGLGSYFSRRFIAGREDRLALALLVVALLVGLLSAVVAPFTNWAVGWPLPLKALAAVALIAPAAFAMGMPFPSGLAKLERWHAPSVRWAWSLNAAASVLGSAAAICLAIYLGLRATLLIGGVLYLLAFAALAATARYRRGQAA